MNRPDREDLKTALKKDFNLLYQKQFTTDWKAQRIVIGLEIDVMGLPNLEKVIDQTLERVVEETTKEIDSYIDGCKSTDGFCEGCSLLGKIRIYLSSLPKQSITDTSKQHED